MDGPIGGGTRREECEARARRDDDAQSETVVLSTRWDIRDLRTPASRSHARSRGGGEAGDRRGARGRDRDDDDDDAFADVAVYVRDARSRASPHITTAELRTPPRLSPTDPRPPRRERLYSFHLHHFLPLFFRLRSLISRSAASRAAARTSGFSARFFVINCERWAGDGRGIVREPRRREDGDERFLLSLHGGSDPFRSRGVGKKTRVRERRSRRGRGSNRTSRFALTRERFWSLTLRFLLRAASTTASCERARRGREGGGRQRWLAETLKKAHLARTKHATGDPESTTRRRVAAANPPRRVVCTSRGRSRRAPSCAPCGTASSTRASRA